jgi:hypothetical protein
LIVKPGKYAKGINLPHKRSTKSTYDYQKKTTTYYEKLSLIAFEGSSLTLMGLVKYDPAANNGKGAFRMTDVSGFIAGGLSECKKLIT